MILVLLGFNDFLGNKYYEAKIDQLKGFVLFNLIKEVE